MTSLPSTLPSSRHTPLRGGPTLRWGVLAPGRIANAWVSTVHANTDQRVVAVASRSAERAAAFASQHGIARSYGDYAALVGDPEVDIVYIAAPHSEHRALAEMATAAGKHVLIEKPIATNAEDAEAIAAAARSAGVFAMEAMWSRFLPQTTVLRQLLDDGALGAPRQVAADFGARFPFDPHSRAFDPALGGGSLLDLGVYTVWFSGFVLGLEPARVTAHGSLAVTGVDEQAVVTLDYGTATAVASSSMVAHTPIGATIGAEGAVVSFQSPFCGVGGFTVTAGEERLDWRDPAPLIWNDGLCYQVTAAAAHVAAGRTEAPEHPLEQSIQQLRIIDEARRQLGAA
ncbi:Gfo/Idh/MocA family protein [uncultured Schumannella sp.]|uniref:Gfo/Idh/MocA family protein n=1 Tax=uncultured Schumannella sp. TaxID=1195956 RepID=UPI0025EE2BB7|nr:Gfo/Idh/MocA family oxidoreductase [uncultured Schumannella sp.]